MFVSTRLLKVANSRSLRHCSRVHKPLPSLPVHSSQLKHSNPLVQPECLSLVFGLWFPGVAGRSGRPHCHHDQMLMHKAVRW